MALTKVTRGGITADAVDGTKIADDAVDSEHYAATSVDNAHINDLAASKLTGTIATARLGSGTASSSTILYGDQTYKTEPAGFDPDAAVVFNESGADVDFRVESDNLTHALFIDGANGNFFLGGRTSSTTDSDGFEVSNGGTNLKMASTNGQCAWFNRQGSDGNIIDFLNDDSGVGSVSVISGGAQFNTSTAKTIALNSSGLTFDTGSNYLDDYEEGTWTPTLISAGGDATVSGGSYYGRYVKIGRQVTLTFWFSGVTVSSQGIWFSTPRRWWVYNYS